MEAQLTLCRDKAVWNRFVAQSPHRSVFCLTDYLDALETNYEMWLLGDGKRTLAGALLLKDSAGNTLRAPYPFSMYQGILLDAAFGPNTAVHSRINEGLEVVSHLLSELAQRHPHLSFCLHHRFEDTRALSWFHYHEPEQGRFQLAPYYTGEISLEGFTDFDAYLATIRPSKRRQYRSAVKNGLRAETSRDVDILEYLYKLTFERQGMEKDLDELRLLRSIASTSIEKGFGELLLARLPAGEVASATLFLHDDRAGYYSIGANHPDFRQSYSGIYAFVESFRRCHARGLKFIDVCGINSPNRGDFKISFNAAPRAYFVADWQAGS